MSTKVRAQESTYIADNLYQPTVVSDSLVPQSSSIAKSFARRVRIINSKDYVSAA